jgi:chromosome segregation ATPase
MANDRSKEHGITSNELEYILDVNRKAVQIYSDVANQNEEMIKKLDKLSDKIDLIEKHTEETNKSLTLEVEDRIKSIDKSIFRLIIILSSTGVGLIYTIIQSFFHH